MTLGTKTGGTWRKSSHSSDNGGNCVEAVDLGESVAIRDSKDPDGPVLVASAAAWRAFLQLHSSTVK